MNKAEEILQNVKQDYNQIAEHFSQTRFASWPCFKMFLEYIRTGQKVLDLGCGNGRLHKYLKEQGLNVDYYGLDKSEKLINICQEKYPEISSKFTSGEIASLPYDNIFFDLVVCIAAFHHLPTKVLRIKALQEVYRVLQPGGYLLMTNWHLWHWTYFKHWFKLFFHKISVRDFFIPWKSSDGKIKCHRYYYAFTKRELKHLLKRAGFKAERVSLEIDTYHPVYGRGVNLVSVAKKI